MTNTFTLTDSKTGQVIEYQSNPLGGFWRRIFALVLDSLFLAVVGLVLSLLFASQFVQMGVYGRLVGFVIVLLYFGILNSSLGKGQSIGKRILHIKVVNRAGANIPLVPSLIRTLILVTPCFLNGILLPPSTISTIVSIIITAIIFCLAGALGYLYLFNRNGRQSIHDLVSGTYVVRDNLSGPVYTELVSKIHFVVLTIIIAIGITLPFLLNSVASGASLEKLVDLQKKINKSENVSNVIASEGVNYYSGRTSEYIVVTVFVKDIAVSENLVKSVAQQVLKVPAFAKKDFIGITTSYGYDIGIWSSYYRQNYWKTPQEWFGQVK